MRTEELQAYCDICRAPIANSEGHIWLDQADVDRVEQGIAEWKATHDQKQEGFVVTRASAYETFPQAAHWRATHTVCDPEEDTSKYVIEVERCRTWADLVAWTAQLMGKNWLRVTDWDDLLREATTGWPTPQRVCPASRPRLNL